MPATARSFGLRVDSSVDERLDIHKATRASARYIRKHLKTFHDSVLWAVAAYNAGGSNLRRKTAYQKGMSFEIVKQASYPSYALARTVQAIMDNGVCVDKTSQM
jgi:soluble lytic murein transglycosylase-like protein